LIGNPIRFLLQRIVACAYTEFFLQTDFIAFFAFTT